MGVGGHGSRRAAKGLVLAVVALTVFLMVWGSATGALSPGSVSLVILFSPLTWAAVAIMARLSEGAPYRFTNHTLTERIDNLVDMLSRARREVVIVTGCLHHDLYDHRRVVDALRRLPRAVDVRLIHTTPRLDERSRDFMRLLMKRGVIPMFAKGGPIRHGVVVDARDTKLEELGVADEAPQKIADYYYNNKAVAQGVLAEIEALETVESAFPAPEATIQAR